MRARNVIVAMMAVFTLMSAAYAYQQFSQCRFIESRLENAPIPDDVGAKTEYFFARLKYPNIEHGPPANWLYPQPDPWTYGRPDFWLRRGHWQVDYPKAERTFMKGVQRLTRLHARTMEEVVDLDSDNIMNFPWIYAVEAGHWDLPQHQADKLREYLLKGGFLMCDDFHGTFDWSIFTASMKRVFPDRAITDIPNPDAIFHTLYDLDDRYQVPGAVMCFTHLTHEYDGYEAKWRAIRDDNGRIMVAICHNVDLGDAWEHADHPDYPERYSALAYRIGLNYIIYAMTH
ncbi:MAG: DUF4159 domain-containing protein [Acidobacteria bacterium]|nr:DUF4159 domain-containing protein [Acidobacteriota bacterium]